MISTIVQTQAGQRVFVSLAIPRIAGSTRISITRNVQNLGRPVLTGWPNGEKGQRINKDI
jgi:hypothetical protein